MTIHLEERASVVANELANTLNDTLQTAVANAGWRHPIELVSTEGKLVVAYEENHEENIFDTEYGSEGSSPNSVIRPFIIGSEATIKQALNDEALNYLFLNGILP